VQIETLRKEGLEPWDAVFAATGHLMRPILLTAAAASLGLVPIAREVFWGPTAYAMVGGIIVGTVVALLFLPPLYVAWFGIKEPAAGPGAAILAEWKHEPIAGERASLFHGPMECRRVKLLSRPAFQADHI
jgi:hypothetical protein